MTRITRYILAELLLVFAVALTGMTALMILAFLAQEAVRQGLGPSTIIQLLPYVLPKAMQFAIPGTMLFAACSVYGRLSSANEITAIKSLGVSPMATLWPALILSFLISLVAVWLNDLASSWGRIGMHRVISQSIEQIAYGMLRTHRAYNSPRFSIEVKEVDGRRLVMPTITMQSADDKSLTLEAEEAELRSHPERGTLGLVVSNYTFELGMTARGDLRETREFEIPLSEASRAGETGNHPTEIAMGNLAEQVELQSHDIHDREQALAANAAFQLAMGDFVALGEGEWIEQQQKLGAGQARLYRLNAEPWRRWANGFSCFFFVLVGAPAAIWLRNADVFSTFGKCFLPILLLYYPLLMAGIDRSKAGVWPPYAVWLGNGVMMIVGLWILIRRVMRY